MLPVLHSMMLPVLQCRWHTTVLSLHELAVGTRPDVHMILVHVPFHQIVNPQLMVSLHQSVRLQLLKKYLDPSESAWLLVLGSLSVDLNVCYPLYLRADVRLMHHLKGTIHNK